MKLCTNCQTNHGSIRLTKTKDGQLFNHYLCQDCLKKESTIDDTTRVDKILSSIHSFVEKDKKNNTIYRYKQKDTKETTSQLNKYTVNLNERIKHEGFDPVIQRDSEMERLMHILRRRTKNNPCLIGEPGVGKTAIVEGFVQKIIRGEIDDSFKNKTILSLDIASVTAGTMYRGVFEDRMKKILNELTFDDSIILFIDEIHMIMGAGSSTDNKIDIANLLKPYLARGSVQVIGATTYDEFRLIQKDAALERRFQTLTVKEPNESDTFRILSSLKQVYENHHHVLYPDSTLQTCIELSNRFITHRFMPDKAIDLLDEVGSRMRPKKDSTAPYTIKDSDIEKVLEKVSNIPISLLTHREKEGLIDLPNFLESKIKGQRDAIKATSSAIKRRRVNLRKQHKPIVLFFSGPTGVGKTALAKRLTTFMFGNENKMIRFDMSEFMEEHSVSKLIGSPPGYVGHEQSGQLTDAIKKEPYSVILLDEFEKANEKIQHLFLQVFDDGRLTDSKGKTYDFSNTVIILTSNISTKEGKTGFIQSPDNQSPLTNAFSPEFINRIDSIIPFEPLKEKTIAMIIDDELIHFNNDLKAKGISITLTDKAKRYLIDKGFNEKYGARPLFRTIVSELEDPITDLFIQEKSLSNIVIDYSKNAHALTFNY